MQQISILVVFICFLASTASLYGQMSLEKTKINLAKINNQDFLIALDSIFLEIAEQRNTDKGYMYLHQVEEVSAVNTCKTLRFDIGWRNDNPNDITSSSEAKHLFFQCDRFAVLTNFELIADIDYVVIGLVELTDEYLDDLIHEDEELIGLNSVGDTILYQKNWRPTSVYIHPSFSMEYIVCSSP